MLPHAGRVKPRGRAQSQSARESNTNLRGDQNRNPGRRRARRNPPSKATPPERVTTASDYQLCRGRQSTLQWARLPGTSPASDAKAWSSAWCRNRAGYSPALLAKEEASIDLALGRRTEK